MNRLLIRISLSGRKIVGRLYSLAEAPKNDVGAPASGCIWWVRDEQIDLDLHGTPQKLDVLRQVLLQNPTCHAILRITTDKKLSSALKKAAENGLLVMNWEVTIYKQLVRDKPLMTFESFDELVSQHTELKKPVTLDAWKEIVLATDESTAFQGYAATFAGVQSLRITPELKAILDDFVPKQRKAVFAIRKGTIEGFWLDPFHNYMAIEFSKARGDEEDAVLTISLGQTT